MADDASTSLPERVRRPVAFAVGVLARNWRALLVDAVVIAAWVGLAGVAFTLAGWPLLAYYVVMVGGVVAYTLVRKPLEAPGE